MLEWLIGGSKTADKLIDGGLSAVNSIGEYIDEQQLTDEEKQKLKAESIAKHSEFIIKTQEENSKRSTTRRGIAWSIIGTNLFILMVCVTLVLFGLTEPVVKIMDLTVAIQSTPVFIAVIAFYFGSHLIKR